MEDNVQLVLTQLSEVNILQEKVLLWCNLVNIKEHFLSSVGV